MKVERSAAATLKGKKKQFMYSPHFFAEVVSSLFVIADRKPDVKGKKNRTGLEKGSIKRVGSLAGKCSANCV